MRRLLLALPLAAACSSDPVPVDSGPADTGMVDTGPLDVGPARCTPGLSTTCSCGALGTSTYVCPPSGLAPAVCPCVDVDASATDVPEDRPAPADAGSDAGPVDAVAVGDAPAVDALDAGGADAGADVVAVADAVALEDVVDVQLVDVAADRPDAVAVDVPRDAGAVDGGPVVYDLEAVRAGLEVRLAFTRVSYTGSRTVCDAPSAPSCAVRAGEVNFFLNGCFGGNSLTGRITTGTGSRTGALDFNGQYLPTLRIASGAVRGGRQSFHVQFAGPVSGTLSGSEGIPGRTVDPALGDLWLLGCGVE